MLVILASVIFSILMTPSSIVSAEIVTVTEYTPSGVPFTRQIDTNSAGFTDKYELNNGRWVIKNAPAGAVEAENKKIQARDDRSFGARIVSGIIEAFQVVFGILFATILWIPVFISSLFLSITASLFDFLVNTTVFGFSDLFRSYFESGVNAAWTTFRDMANILMIAIFVFVAFNVILNIQTYGLKQFGVRILIVALLINFSLFFTKLFVDASNLTAYQFRQGIVASGTNTDSISSVFMQRAGMTTTAAGGIPGVSQLWDSVSNTFSAAFQMNGSVWTYVIVTTLFFSAAGAIFLFASILLITRVITFLLLMITSPLAFIAYMTPAMDKWWDKWWSELIRNAIFAPLFMMLIWAVVGITTNFTGDTDLFKFTTSGPGSENLINVRAYFNIAIVLGLLYASTKIASELSLLGSKFAMDIGKKGLGFTTLWSTLAAGKGLEWQGRLFRAGIRRFTQFNPTRDTRGVLQGAAAGASTLPLGANISKKLNQMSLSSMQAGDLKIAKKLEELTGARLPKGVSPEDEAAYRLRTGQDQVRTAAVQATPPPVPGSPEAAAAEDAALADAPRTEVYSDKSDTELRKDIMDKRDEANQIQRSIDALQADISSGQLAKSQKTRKLNERRRLMSAIGEKETEITELRDVINKRAEANLRGDVVPTATPTPGSPEDAAARDARLADEIDESLGTRLGEQTDALRRSTRVDDRRQASRDTKMTNTFSRLAAGLGSSPREAAVQSNIAKQRSRAEQRRSDPAAAAILDRLDALDKTVGKQGDDLSGKIKGINKGGGSDS